MFINIEMDSEIPIYTQLANGLIEGVARGSLKTGTTLPSVRSLAADLGVNMHTVNKAYHELEKKGIVTIVPKSGAVVNGPTPGKLNRNRISDTLRPVVAEALAVGLSENDIQLMISELTTRIKEEQ